MMPYFLPVSFRFASLGTFCALALLFDTPRSAAQTVDFSSCPSSECRFNHSVGTTNSVSVGVNSSLGSNSSAQGSLHHQADSSSSVSLQSSSAGQQNVFGKNVNFQSIGGNFTNVLSADSELIRDPSTQQREQDWVSSPVNISINTNTTKSSSVDGKLQESSSSSETGAVSSSSKDGISALGDSQYQDQDASSSVASFTAEGLSAYQDLSLTGEDSDSLGSYAKSSVKQLVRYEGGTPIYKDEPVMNPDGSVMTEQVPVFNDDGTPKMHKVLLEDSNGLPILTDNNMLQYVEKQVTEARVVYNTVVAGYSSPDGNPILEGDFATGSASAGINTSTRFSADVTSSNFVNAFMSAF